MLWMRNVLYRFSHLDTWLLISGTVWEGYGTISRRRHDQEQTLRVNICVHFLFPSSSFCFLFVVELWYLIFLLLSPCLPVAVIYLPAIKDSCPSRTTSHINTFFHNHGVSSQQPKAMAIMCVLLLKWWKSFAEFDELHWRDVLHVKLWKRKHSTISVLM